MSDVLLLMVAAASGALLASLWARSLYRRRSERRTMDLARRIDRVRRGELSRLADSGPEVDAVVARSINALTDEIRRQGSQLGAAFAALQEGLVVLDREGVIQVTNPAASTLLGEGLQHGRRLAEATRQPEVLDAVRAARSGSEWVLSPVYESVGGRLLQPQAGMLDDGKTALVVRDVTLERQVETMRREFVANVSHELKTPLTAIRGYAETLEGSLEDPALARFAQRILVQCRRLEALLADVMELAKLESDEVMRRTERVAVDLRELLDEAIERVRESYPDSQTQIELEAPTIVEYRGYREFLGQLFGNLLDNAVKYSPGGSRVGVQLVDGGDEVAVVIEDDGPGIASEHLPHLFERFYRVDSGRARSTGGTGLGLAIVKHAARVHGGVVKVQSRLGHGTRFEVQLPRRVAGSQ